jgi:hypothetical protein
MTQWQPPQESRSDYPRHPLARDFAVNSRGSRVEEPCATFSAKNMRRLRAARGLTQGVLAYELRDQSDLPQFGRAILTQRLNRQRRPHCRGARSRDMGASEG